MCFVTSDEARETAAELIAGSCKKPRDVLSHLLTADHTLHLQNTAQLKALTVSMWTACLCGRD